MYSKDCADAESDESSAATSFDCKGLQVGSLGIGSCG